MRAEPYPWQKKQWGQLAQASVRHALPHALLLTGPRGIGKGDFALLLANVLLCDSPAEGWLPCGACRSCVLFRAGTHPDFRNVIPGEDRNGRPRTHILVDQVRDLNAWFSLTRQFQGHKVVVIGAADIMNFNAANSLLKMLEEPAAGVVLILATAHPRRLPATILSRCQRIQFPAATPEQASAWLCAEFPDHDPQQALVLARGAPLRVALLEGERAPRDEALRALLAVRSGRRSAVSAAAQLADVDAGVLIAWMVAWVADIVQLRCLGAAARPVNVDLRQPLGELGEDIPLQSLYGLYDRLLELRSGLGVSLNAQLMREDLVLAWKNATVRKG